MPEEKIGLEEALDGLHNREAARAGFMEEKVGSLEYGKFADLVVLSQDLFPDGSGGNPHRSGRPDHGGRGDRVPQRGMK